MRHGSLSNGVATSNYTVELETRILAEVPAGATTGKISATTLEGTAVSAEDFTVTTPSSTIVLNPTDDAYVRLSSPNSNNGTATTLRQRQTSSESITTYLKFNMSGLSGLVQSAKLRFYVMDGSNSGGSVYVVSNNYHGTATPWTEGGLNWNNAPAITGTTVSTLGTVSIGIWVEFDVTSAIVGNGIYSFGLKTNSSDLVSYSSKEGANKPELVIQTGSSSSSILNMIDSKLNSTDSINEEIITPLPQKINFSNPFPSHGTIEYTLPEAANVRLAIYNILGQLGYRLVDEFQSPGYKRVRWDGKEQYGRKVKSGIYFLQLEIDRQKVVRKMILQ